MPDISLDQFRQVDVNAQVGIEPENDGQLSVVGERHVFLGRLVDHVTRTDEQRESYRGATRAFIAAVKKEYGDNIGSWVTKELSEHVEKGKPLTGYRIEQILNEANEALEGQRSVLENFVETKLPELVETEIQALEAEGMEITDTLREHLQEKARETMQGRIEFINPARLKNGIAETFGPQVRAVVRERAGVLSQAMKHARETVRAWSSAGETYPVMEDPGVCRRFYEGVLEKLEPLLRKEGIHPLSTPEQRSEAVDRMLPIAVGQTFKELSGMGTGELGESRPVDDGTMMEREFDSMTETVDSLQHLNETQKGELKSHIEELRTLRDTILTLDREQQGDLGLVLDLCGKLSKTTNAILSFEPPSSNREARREWNSAWKGAFSYLPKKLQSLPDQTLRLRDTLFRRLDMPQLTKEPDIAKHFDTLGRAKLEIESQGLELFNDPIHLLDTLQQLDRIESDLAQFLEKPGHSPAVRESVTNLLGSVRFSKEQIQTQQKAQLSELNSLKDSGFNISKMKSYLEHGGSLDSEGRQELRQLLEMGATPEEILAYQNKGFDREKTRTLIRHGIAPDLAERKLRDAEGRSSAIKWRAAGLEKGFDHLDLLWILRNDGDQGTLEQFTPQEIHLLQEAKLSLNEGLDYKAKGIPITPDTLPKTFHKALPGSKPLEGGSVSKPVQVEFLDKQGVQHRGVFKEEVPGSGYGGASSDIGIDRDNPRMGMRNIATKRLDDLMGFGIVPKTEFTLLEGKVGVMMEFAPGAPAMFKKYDDVTGTDEGELILERLEQLNVIEDPEAREAVAKEIGHVDEEGRVFANRGIRTVDLDFTDPQLRRELVKLQLLDALTGQGDRHGGNYMVLLDDSGKFSGLQAIDNDQAFGRLTTDPYQLMQNTSKPIMLELLGRGVGDTLGSLTEQSVRETLGGSVSEEEITKRVEQLNTAHELIGQLSQALESNNDDQIRVLSEKLERFDFQSTLEGLVPQEEIDRTLGTANELRGMHVRNVRGSFRGVELPQLIDTEMKVSIDKLTEEGVRESLQGLLSEEEIEATLGRLRVMKDHVLHLERTGCVITPDQWGSRTATEALSDPTSSYVARDFQLRRSIQGGKMEMESYESVARN